MVIPNKIYLLCLFLLPVSLNAQPLFDAHLHYNAAHAEKYTPQDIIKILQRNDMQHAVVTSAPASYVARLFQLAPERIVPLLSAYRCHDDKLTWPDDPTLPQRLEAELKQGTWRGIGELHIFAKDRHSPVFHQIIKLAEKHQLPLLIHGDPAVIDTLYEIAPAQRVAWAHAGTVPYPDLIADYLQRYPALSIDVSVRDERIAPNGRITDDWYELFINFPDRVMVGVDTYSLQRWDNFDAAVTTIRNWLTQLPEDMSKQLAFENASAFFIKSGKNKQK